MEFATETNLDSKDPTFEILTAYRFGEMSKSAEKTRKKVSIYNKNQNKTAKKRKRKNKNEKQRERDPATQKRIDSLNQHRIERLTKANEDKETDEVVLEENERYEEVASEDGLIPGFYLVANVFSSPEYYKAFMQDLVQKGLQPKSFLRSSNNYQYVYLERYNTISEARKARNSKFFGKYTDELWIFRVIGE